MDYIESGWNGGSVVSVVNRLRAAQMRNCGLVPDRDLFIPNRLSGHGAHQAFPKTGIEASV
jgi:hypothetical protein